MSEETVYTKHQDLTQASKQAPQANDDALFAAKDKCRLRLRPRGLSRRRRRPRRLPLPPPPPPPPPPPRPLDLVGIVGGLYSGWERERERDVYY